MCLRDVLEITLVGHKQLTFEPASQGRTRNPFFIACLHKLLRLKKVLLYCPPPKERERERERARERERDPTKKPKLFLHYKRPPLFEWYSYVERDELLARVIGKNITSRSRRRQTRCRHVLSGWLSPQHPVSSVPLLDRNWFMSSVKPPPHHPHPPHLVANYLDCTCFE